MNMNSDGISSATQIYKKGMLLVIRNIRLLLLLITLSLLTDLGTLMYYAGYKIPWLVWVSFLTAPFYWVILVASVVIFNQSLEGPPFSVKTFFIEKLRLIRKVIWFILVSIALDFILFVPLYTASLLLFGLDNPLVYMFFNIIYWATNLIMIAFIYSPIYFLVGEQKLVQSFGSSLSFTRHNILFTCSILPFLIIGFAILSLNLYSNPFYRLGEALFIPVFYLIILSTYLVFWKTRN